MVDQKIPDTYCIVQKLQKLYEQILQTSPSTMVALEADGSTVWLPPSPLPLDRHYPTIQHPESTKLEPGWPGLLTQQHIMTPGRQLHIEQYSQSPPARASLTITDNTLPLQFSTASPPTFSPAPEYDGFIPTITNMTTYQLDQCNYNTKQPPSTTPMLPTLPTKVPQEQLLASPHTWQSNTQQCWILPPTTPVPTIPLTHNVTTASHHPTLMMTNTEKYHTFLQFTAL